LPKLKDKEVSPNERLFKQISRKNDADLPKNRQRAMNKKACLPTKSVFPVS